MNRRIIFLIAIGSLLVAGSYPAWLAFAEHTARMDRVREILACADGQHAKSYFGRFATKGDVGAIRLLLRLAHCLDVFGESPLNSNSVDKNDIYCRFTWLRTFNRPVIFSVRIKSDDDATLTIKVSDGAGGYDLGKVVRNETKTLSKPVVVNLRSHIIRLLQLDYVEQSYGYDGAEWLIEVFMRGHHHIVWRWSPQKGEVRDIGLLLMEQAPNDPDLAPVY